MRPGRRDDLDEIQTLAAESTRQLCGAEFTPEQASTLLRFGLAVDDQLLADRTCWVVESPQRGGIIAVGAWSFRAAVMGNFHPTLEGNPLQVLNPGVDPARLRGFFTHPLYARRGLARRLVAICERAAARAGFFSIELMSTRSGTDLFRACGFEDMESVTNLFANGVYATGYRMIRPLEPCGAAVVNARPAWSTWDRFRDN
jgi:GNAT superfamily N-acetyltransferase